MRVLVGPNGFGLQQVIEELSPKFPGIEFAFCADRADLAPEIADADIYFGWLGRDEFLAAEKIRWVQSPSSGTDRFLAIPELCDGEVILTSARGTHGACLAEHALAMIFAFTRGIKCCVVYQQKHQWANRELRPGMSELTGLTMGIVGFGTVGRALAKRAAAFDMRIVAVDLFPTDKPDYVESLTDLSNLDGLLGESDVVVVTVPYTAETRHMIGERELGLMKHSAILIGISRGGIIDQEALARALEAGELGGAGLDVSEPEPLPADSPLWDLQNCLISPHIAGGSQFEAPTIREIFCENLKRFVQGEFPLRSQVDKIRGF